jgi:hypothetical protein
MVQSSEYESIEIIGGWGNIARAMSFAGVSSGVYCWSASERA